MPGLRLPAEDGVFISPFSCRRVQQPGDSDEDNQAKTQSRPRPRRGQCLMSGQFLANSGAWWAAVAAGGGGSLINCKLVEFATKCLSGACQS